jgi:hypothetical protein
LPSVFARSPRQRRHILFFCFPHWQTYILHPQVHRNMSTSPQMHKVSQIQWNKFTTWSTKPNGLRWVLVWWERWDVRLEDLLTTWSLVIRTHRERLHKGDKIASVRHD